MKSFKEHLSLIQEGYKEPIKSEKKKILLSSYDYGRLNEIKEWENPNIVWFKNVSGVVVIRANNKDTGEIMEFSQKYGADESEEEQMERLKRIEDKLGVKIKEYKGK